jgi:hypothetical protein
LAGQQRRPSGPGVIPGGQWSAEAAGGAGGDSIGAAGFAGIAGAGMGGAFGASGGGSAVTHRPSTSRLSPGGQGCGAAETHRPSTLRVSPVGQGGGAQAPAGDSTSPGLQRPLRSSALLPGQARRSFGSTGCEQHSPVDVRLALAQHWPAPEGT